MLSQLVRESFYVVGSKCGPMGRYFPYEGLSKLDASCYTREMKSLIFTHLETDMGERVHAQKCAKLLGNAELFDIPTLLGDDYEAFASLNYALADGNQAPMEESFIKVESEGDLNLILSWSHGLAAMLATGVHRQRRTIAKLYAHQTNERILKTLYEPVDLLITESLLASERAAAYGLESLYIPHHYTAQPKSCRSYVNALAESQGKKVRDIVIGTVSRLEYWKNPEFAIEAVRQLAQSEDVMLVLKGDFPKEKVYPDYHERLSEMLEAYQNEPWLLWDRKSVGYPDVLNQYASFDVCLQPSGAEGGSNVVVELLAMGKPTLLLDASSNPYLFKGELYLQKQAGRFKRHNFHIISLT